MSAPQPIKVTSWARHLAEHFPVSCFRTKWQFDIWNSKTTTTKPLEGKQAICSFFLLPREAQLTYESQIKIWKVVECPDRHRDSQEAHGYSSGTAGMSALMSEGNLLKCLPSPRSRFFTYKIQAFSQMMSTLVRIPLCSDNPCQIKWEWWMMMRAGWPVST